MEVFINSCFEFTGEEPFDDRGEDDGLAAAGRDNDERRSAFLPCLEDCIYGGLLVRSEFHDLSFFLLGFWLVGWYVTYNLSSDTCLIRVRAREEWLVVGDWWLVVGTQIAFAIRRFGENPCG